MKSRSHYFNSLLLFLLIFSSLQEKQLIEAKKQIEKLERDICDLKENQV